MIESPKRGHESDPRSAIDAVTEALGDDALLTVEDVARVVGCSTRNIYAMIHRKAIPFPIKVGALTRWRLGTIRQWIAGGCSRRR